jgi:predicted phosphodiesterase
MAAREYRLLVNGHSHKPMVRQFAALTVINAGTLHRDYQPRLVLVDLDARQASYYAIALDGRVQRDGAFALPSG